MTHIKRLVMQGFKSFPSKTEVIFDKGINTIVGPNGSGKSNISDALCFALGRLSIKSIRAAKAKNLLFMGTKTAKPAREAFVEMIFENSGKTFNLPKQEVSIKRIVRHNGQSVYKINDETKTRSEVIETLAQAGIDPHGFNIILQGNIQAFVKMHPEERRKILEEVAGIAIYESRKEKSLKELEKTEARLKEISTVLRERTAYLRNLENERSQALKYKELENTIKKCKVSILNKKITEKNKEIESVRKSIEQKLTQRDKFKAQSESLQSKLEEINQKINQINKHIQKSTGVEQDTLHDTIANLKAELEGLKVRKENYENRKAETQNRIEQMKSSIPEHESEIADLREESPLLAKKQEDLKRKKQELSILEEERKSAYKFKTELTNARERLKEKQSESSRVEAESNSLLKQIEDLSEPLQYQDKNLCQKEMDKSRKNLSEIKGKIDLLNSDEIAKTKIISSCETKIENASEIKSKIKEIDICPLCQNKMTEKHVSHVLSDSDSKIKESQATIKESSDSLENLKKDRESLQNKIKNLESALENLEKELTSHDIISEKQNYLQKLTEQENILKKEISELEQKRENLEKKSWDISGIEERYNNKILEIEEISSRTEKDIDTTLLFKERELEKLRDIIKRSTNDVGEIDEEIEEISSTMGEKSSLLDQKEKEEEALNEKFKKMFEERDSMQETIQKESYSLSTIQSEIRQVEEQVNYLKVGNAKLDAEREALEMELTDYPNTEQIKGSMQFLQEKLQKAQQAFSTIGSINMRALEVYDKIKDEYDKVKEKADTVDSEKQGILDIIEEIDKKKKKAFMQTYKSINELFKDNFSRLSSKGEAFLEIENKEDLFSGGINIVIKMGKGKYFDVTSLSGGEQTLIALSLLFAIQEHKPYHFYIFDEIDAALDKRNSERLSGLLKQYMQKGQYIVVTHNDAIITDSNFLYGVSMHDGISKILSLKLD